MSFEITIEKTQNSRINQFDPQNIGFGKIFTDHMFLANWNGSEWTNARIEPYGPLSLSPATSAIHYGQSIFEGMKAFADKKTGKPAQECKTIKVHKKLEGTEVPVKK